MKTLTSYAQNREDIILASFFPGKTDGFYVDIGAADPVTDSVTKYFYDLGWRGVNIEPNIRLFQKLENARPEDINLNRAIGKDNGEAELRVYTGDSYGLSTLSKRMKDEYSDKKNNLTDTYIDVKVPTSTLSSALGETVKNKTIDFMKVDVEGLEKTVLEGNDWKKYRPSVICIEQSHIFEDWHSLLVDKKYTKVFEDGLNGYYLANEKSKLLETFQDEYLRLAVGQHIVRPDLADELEGHEKVIQKFETKSAQQALKLEEQLNRIAELELQLSSPGVLSSIKLFFKSVGVFIDKKVAALKCRSYTVKLPEELPLTATSKKKLSVQVMQSDYKLLSRKESVNVGWLSLYYIAKIIQKIQSKSYSLLKKVVKR